jgi:hypothetical protein
VRLVLVVVAGVDQEVPKEELESQIRVVEVVAPLREVPV